jgi:hypothetical protein
MLATEENEQGIEAFLDEIGVEHTLGIGEPGTRGRRLFHSTSCFDGYQDVSDENQSHRAALEALYYATGGNGWTSKTNWLSDSVAYCFWDGVKCDWNDDIYYLDLWGNNLVGMIPPEIKVLTTLKMLVFYNNFGLVGAIPPEIGSLQNLEILDIRKTGMSGTIPTEMGNCASLKFFGFSRIPGAPTITGDIPDGLCDLFSTGSLGVISGNGGVYLHKDDPGVVAECKDTVFVDPSL